MTAKNFFHFLNAPLLPNAKISEESLVKKIPRATKIGCIEACNLKDITVRTLYVICLYAPYTEIFDPIHLQGGIPARRKFHVHITSPIRPLLLLLLALPPSSSLGSRGRAGANDLLDYISQIEVRE